MISILDILGTLVFAISGAFRAVKYELDILGVLSLAIATGVGGGLLRDVMLGSTPPAAFKDETYLLICVLGGLIVFVAAPRIAPRWDWVMSVDAVGLGVFAAIGAAKAADHGLGWMGVAMMGAITACGGGVIRDVLVREIPAILKADFYATAALIGGFVLFVSRGLGAGQTLELALAALATTGLRALGMIFHLSLPKVTSLPASPSALTQERKSRKRPEA